MPMGIVLDARARHAQGITAVKAAKLLRVKVFVLTSVSSPGTGFTESYCFETSICNDREQSPGQLVVKCSEEEIPVEL
jgi:hypothetical protein